jgi:hypothetical protein
LEDLIKIQYEGNEARWSQDLATFSAQKLMEARSVVITTHDRNHQAHTRSLEVVVLTKAGKDLLRRFGKETCEAGQALYAGFVKPREIAHDTAIYRMYQAEAAQIEKQGGRIKRVVLDFELKKKAYAPLARARRVSFEEYNRKQREIADDLGLKVIGGKMRLPDLRIEYEKANGEEYAKGKRPRYIPLSDGALQWLDSLPRIMGCPYVFVLLESQDRWRKPEKRFIQARRKADLDWVTIHDLRHFRATQWIMRGVDPRTVQELLGHSTITTTMRYAHFAPNRAARQIIETQQLEARELTGEKQAKSSIEADGNSKLVSINAGVSMHGTGVEPVRPLRDSGF